RRVDVLRADTIAFRADGRLERLARRGDLLRIATLVRTFQALPVLAGELRVDRQQRLAGVSGEAYREFNRLERAFLHACVANELVWSKHLFQQHAKLHFCEAPT